MQNRKLILLLILVLNATLLSCNSSEETKADNNKAYTHPQVINYTQAIELTPEDASLYFKRSIALSHLNQDQLALKDLDKAISLDPKNDAYYIGKGELLYILERYNESVLAYKHAFEINPQKIQIQLAIAKSLLMDNKTDQSQQIINKILKDNPYYPDAFYIQAQVYANQKDTTKAINELKRALKIDPFYYEASLLLAEYWAELKNKNAFPQYLYTYSLDSSDIYPLFQMGYLHEQLQDTLRAKQSYYNIIMLDKDYTDAYIRMGKILVAQDSIEKAQRNFALAVATEPNNSQAHYLLGNTYEQLNKLDSAKLYYANAFGIDPDFKEAKEAFKKIRK